MSDKTYSQKRVSATVGSRKPSEPARRQIFHFRAEYTMWKGGIETLQNTQHEKPEQKLLERRPLCLENGPSGEAGQDG